MDYVIKTSNGLSVSLPADNWIEAFGRALSMLGRDPSAISMLSVHRIDGRYYLEDSFGDGYMVQETGVIGVVAIPPRSATPAPASRRTTTWVPPDASPPPLDTPRPTGMRQSANVPENTRS
jgi:hypothetical protein